MLTAGSPGSLSLEDLDFIVVQFQYHCFLVCETWCFENCGLSLKSHRLSLLSTAVWRSGVRSGFPGAAEALAPSVGSAEARGSCVRDVGDLAPSFFLCLSCLHRSSWTLLVLPLQWGFCWLGPLSPEPNRTSPPCKLSHQCLSEDQKLTAHPPCWGDCSSSTSQGLILLCLLHVGPVPWAGV